MAYINVGKLTEEVNTLGSANYYYYSWTGLTSVTSVVSHSFTLTNKKGNPFVISVNGDLQGEGSSGWCSIAIYRGSTQLTRTTIVSDAASSNSSFIAQTIDSSVTLGNTYTYYIKFYESGSGTINFQENGTIEAPKICAFEL
jgi:hypothetical protein